MRWQLASFLLGAPLLAACAPVSLPTAERQCAAQVYDNARPRSEVAVGITNSGPSARVELDLSTSLFNGRDPSAVYDQCVYRKSGQPPSQPLYTRTDWKG